LDDCVEKNGIGWQLGTKREDEENLNDFWWNNLTERHYFKILALDRRALLKWIFKKKYRFLDSIDLAQERDRWGGYSEHSPEPSGSLKCGIFLD